MRRLAAGMNCKRYISPVLLVVILFAPFTPAWAVADRVSTSEYMVEITGPDRVERGETIEIRVRGCGAGTFGVVETEGLRVLSASGGFSSPKKFVVTGPLGSLEAIYKCTVTAVAGSSCTFALRDVVIVKPDASGEVRGDSAEWWKAVSGAGAGSQNAAEYWTPPATWLDGLLETASQTSAIYWDDVCTAFADVPQMPYVGSAYLAQDRTWEDYSLFMFENDFLIVPFAADGEIMDPELQASAKLATGQHMYVRDLETGKVTALQDVVMRGDVIGSGQLGISQVVRLAEALKGRNPLEGVFFEAGDINENGKLELSDITGIAGWLKGKFVDVGSS